MPTLAETMLSDLDSLPEIQTGSDVLRFELDDLSPEMQEVARNELRETPERQREAVAALRKLLIQEKDLNTPHHNDLWLIKFLRPCKYYPESAFNLIKRYYAFKVKHSDVYDGLIPSKERNVFEHDILTVQPNRDQLGRRVIIIELGKKWNHKQCKLDEVFKAAVLFLEAAMVEPTTQVAGAVVIFDMDGLSLQQTWQFTPQFAKRIVDFLQDSIPARVKNVHVVNEPYIFNIVFNLFKPFLKEKLKNRIKFHGKNRKSLHEYIDPDRLAPVYGGSSTTPRVEGTQWYDLLILADREYVAINSYGYKKKL